MIINTSQPDVPDDKTKFAILAVLEVHAGYKLPLGSLEWLRLPDVKFQHDMPDFRTPSGLALRYTGYFDGKRRLYATYEMATLRVFWMAAIA